MSHELHAKQGEIALAIKNILDSLGEESTRDGLKETPKRVAKSLIELTSGMTYTAEDIAADAIFDCDSDGLILQKNLEFYSLCEHHLLPFFGRVHFAYVPNKKIIGLSKVGRLIDIFAKRLQVQEKLTKEIITALDEVLRPRALAVIIEASHLCMMMRGVKKQGSTTLTAEYLGDFKTNHELRRELLDIIKQ
jgi:GTP cyclohydrolase I